jgi:GNAT superfamily N-acetyltransferase
MNLKIAEVQTKKELRTFLKFPYQLYKDSLNWVPPLLRDEFEIFDPKRNPALAMCKTKQWLATLDGKLVGRIAGIIHEKEAAHTQLGRFGWIDFIDDDAVSTALLREAENWVKLEGLKGIHGPLGFSDMDPEGMLVEGFDSTGTIATIYNFAYYPKHLERHDYKKAADWIEGRGQIPQEPSRRLERTAEIVEGRFSVKSLELKTRKQVADRGRELFTVLNKAYEHLYAFQSLTEGQINYYIKMYLGFVIPDLVSMVVNEKDELVGFAVAMPSMTKAFQKAKGKLFPTGIFHLLAATKWEKTVDLYLIGVLPEYQRMGVTALIFRDLIRAFNKRGFTEARTNIILEDNISTLTQFNEYQTSSEMHKRRRCYIKQF